MVLWGWRRDMSRKQRKIPILLGIVFPFKILQLVYILDLTRLLGGIKMRIIESIEDTKVDALALLFFVLHWPGN